MPKKIIVPKGYIARNGSSNQPYTTIITKICKRPIYKTVDRVGGLNFVEATGAYSPNEFIIQTEVGKFVANTDNEAHRKYVREMSNEDVVLMYEINLKVAKLIEKRDKLAQKVFDRSKTIDPDFIEQNAVE